jgi:hypothetical protein
VSTLLAGIGFCYARSLCALKKNWVTTQKPGHQNLVWSSHIWVFRQN